MVVLLGACRDQRPPAPSAEQSDQLNQAEQMLNAVGNEEGPATEAADPSSNSD